MSPEAGRFTEPSSDWRSRAEFWTSNTARDAIVTKATRAARQPLILSGHGMHLRINHGSLEVRNGFTHYPQKSEIFRLFPGDRDMPSRIIMLGGSGSISLDVLSWLANQMVPLIQLDYRGNVIAAIGHTGIGHDPALVDLQISALQSDARSIEIAAWLIGKKLQATLQTMSGCLPASELRETAISVITEGMNRLGRPWDLTKESLMGIEGKSARLYFDAWRALPISWKGTARRPIPEAWLSIGARRGEQNHSNRFARHPVQAMLNYAYAVVESALRIEVAKVGLDMTIGLLHQSRYERPALIMDLIEPIRPVADRIILDLICSNTFSPVDFTIGSDGTVRLHPQLARVVVDRIGTPSALDPLVAEFMRKIGFKLPPTDPGKGRTWMAQRSLQRDSNNPQTRNLRAR